MKSGRARRATRRARMSTRWGRLAATFLAVTVPAVALTAVPVAADTTGPGVVHVPVTTAPYGQAIKIDATSNCAVGSACYGRLFYRTTAPAALTAVPGLIGESGFQVTGLDGTPTTVDTHQVIAWTGEIPASAATTTGVDYYLEIEQNGAVTRFPGTTKADTTQPTGSYQHVHVLSPPLINHVPVPFAVADQPITVDARVTCSSGNCDATLYYRETPLTADVNVGWAATDMPQQGSATDLGGAAKLLTVSGQVPASSVDTTGVDYYIHVTDGHVQAYHPGTTYQGYYAPRDGIRERGASHHVHVLEPPRLVHEPVATAPYRQPITVTAQTNCPSERQCQATLYYRTTNSSLDAATFASTGMSVTTITPTVGIDLVSVNGTIPAGVVDTRGVDYFFSVTDGTTTSWWPGTSAVDGPGVWVNGTRAVFQHVHVQEPPHLVHVAPTIAPALQDLNIDTELTCATESCETTLHYTTTPNVAGSYQTATMNVEAVRVTTSATRVELRRARIPAAQVTTRGLAYYITALDGYTNTAAPGTSYWGAYAPVDGSNPAPATARFIVRVVDPPHPVHAPIPAAVTGQPIIIDAKSNCATSSCTATLFWRVTAQAWQAATMGRTVQPDVAYGNDLNSYTATIPGPSVTPTGIEYRIEVTDGYVAETTPSYPVTVTDSPLTPPSTTSTSVPLPTTTSVPLPTTTTSISVPPVTTTSTSIPIPPVTTTSTSLPPVTTTSTSIPIPPVTTTSTSIPIPPVTTTSTSLPPVTTTSTSIPIPPVTTTSTSVPTTTTTLPPNVAPYAPSLVAPAANAAFATTDAQLFVINAVDPDGDAYTGTVNVTNTSGTTTSFTTAPALSGVDSEGAPPTPLPSGNYTWRARATDADGTNGPWSPTRTLTVGNQAPIVPTLLSPAPGKAFSGDDIQLFTLASSDAEGDPYTGTITIRTAGGSFVASFPSSLALSGQHSQGTPAPPLPAGDYTWSARATDALGALGPESAPRAFSVIVNRPPNIPTLVAPTPNKTYYEHDTQVFTLAADDANGDVYTGTVTIKDSWGLVTDTFTTAPAPSGEYSSGVPTFPLTSGQYTWSATATDVNGATGMPSPERQFTVSSTPDIPPAALPSDTATTRASLNTLREEGLGGQNENPVISADGRYVAFESEADNLVLDDTNFRKDVFVHDRLTGITERVSISDSEAQASASGWFESFGASISADGRYVAFVSYADNLVPGDTNATADVFVRDREAGTTTRASVSSGGTQANGVSYTAAISGDGMSVAFASQADNLVGGDTNWSVDIFVRDIDTSFTERVSTRFYYHTEGNNNSWNPSISHNGQIVVFESEADNLETPGYDNNFTQDVFYHDRSSSYGTLRVSTDPNFNDANALSRDPKVSASGRWIVYTSPADNIVSGDTNGKNDIFLYDRQWSDTWRVSVNSSQAQANDHSYHPNISPDAGHVTFVSSATNLVAGDRNGADDIFLRRTDTEDPITAPTTLISHDADGHQALGRSGRPSVSNEGTHLAFTSWAQNLVPSDTNRAQDVFAYNRKLSLTCVAGALSAVGCLSGYGFKASSDRIGLEEFYGYHAFDAGSDTAFLNVSNGNLVVQGTDLNIPAQGLDLRLTHTYNSQKEQGEGPLGKGWRIGVADGESGDFLGSLVSAVLAADVGQILEVIVTEDQFDFFDADGTRHHFIKGGLDGPGWHAPPGVNLTLTDYLVGVERRYKATRPDGVVYEFHPTSGGAGYSLRTITDRNGNQLTFNYSSGKLSSITDANGRALTFSWSGDYLSSATYGGTTVSYSVVDNRLRSISVGGRTTSYTYAGYTGELVAVTDARNNSTQFTIDGGMLTNVRDREGKDWAIKYNGDGCQPADPGAAVATCITEPSGGPGDTGGTQVYTSSAEGNLLAHTDAGDTAPNTRSYMWEGNRVVYETDAGGHTNEYAYNQNGQIILKRESGPHEETLSTAMVYRDAAPGVSDLVEAHAGVDSSDLRIWKFTRSETGNLLATTDPAGDIMKFDYHAGGRLASVTDAKGRTTSYSNYHPSGQPRTITDPLGHAKNLTFDDFGRTTSIVDRNGVTWGIGYDTRGNVISRSSPQGTATYGYDANDNQTSATPPGGATVTRTYTARDLLEQSYATIGGVLRKSTYTYFADGHLKEIFEPRTFAGSPTTTQKVAYELYANNRVRAMIDEEGHRTELTYTPEGRVRTAMEPQGTAGNHLTTYTYNRRGQVVSLLESGHEAPITNTYNAHGELLSSRTPKGSVTSFVYDKMGRPLRTVDAQGRQSTRTYDSVGNLVTLTQPEGQGGQLTTTYSYTARNEIASESDPADGGHIVEYQYDNEGRQTFRYDKYNGAVERTVAQTYRNDGAMLTRTATGPGLATHTSTFGYDTAGNLTSATAAVGGSTVSSLSMGLNEAFEIANWTETIYDPSGNPRTKSGTYGYQPDGLLASRTIDGHLTTYTHTATGREKTMSPWGGGTFANEYFDNGLLRQTSIPNGVVVDQLFDTADRLVSRLVQRPTLGSTPISAWTGIVYDDDDQRTKEVVSQRQPAGAPQPEKGGTGNYTYDSLGRLTSANHPFEPDNTVTYTLDDGGNVLKDADTAYTYDKNRLVRSAGSTTEQFEDGGTRTQVDVATYEYDHLGNQKKESSTTTRSARLDEFDGTETTNHTRTFAYDAASHPTKVTSEDGSWVGYAYDALGRLVRRVEHPVSGSDVVTLFFHDGPVDQLALETDGTGNVQVRYLIDSQGDPIGQDKNGTRSYYVDDPRGNLTQQLDGSGNSVSVYGYDPYGKEKQAHTSASGSWDSRLRFQMAPRDPVTGSYNLGPRLLDPSINRFVGADSYVASAANMSLSLDPLTGNRYLYAGANPAGMIDDGHGWGFLKKVAKVGKALLKNSVVRGIVIGAAAVAACGTGILCGAVVGAIVGAGLSTANYVANSKTLTIGGAINAAKKGAISGAIEGATAAAAAAAKAAQAAKAAEAARAAKQAKVAERVLGAACSFSGATTVVMADGSRKAISKIKVGDRVLAEDPETGERGPREVTHVWVHKDTVVDLEIDGDLVTTTEDHPFWNATDNEWQDAQDLDLGDLVRTADGELVLVGGVEVRSARWTTAFNLTVDDIHTFFVGVGEDAILVHNTCGGLDLDALSAAGRAADRNGLTVAGRSAQKHGARGQLPASLDRTASGYNQHGQDLLDDLLTAPNTATRTYAHRVHGSVTEFLGPQYGARFGPNGDLIGFI